MRDAQEMIPGTSLNCSDSISISKEAFDNDPKASLKRYAKLLYNINYQNGEANFF
jgi:hypothetical protein